MKKIMCCLLCMVFLSSCAWFHQKEKETEPKVLKEVVIKPEKKQTGTKKKGQAKPAQSKGTKKANASKPKNIKKGTNTKKKGSKKKPSPKKEVYLYIR